MTFDHVELHILLWLALALAILAIGFLPVVLPGYAELFLNAALFQFLC